MHELNTHHQDQNQQSRSHGSKCSVGFGNATDLIRSEGVAFAASQSHDFCTVPGYRVQQ